VYLFIISRSVSRFTCVCSTYNWTNKKYRSLQSRGSHLQDELVNGLFNKEVRKFRNVYSHITK